MSRAYGPEDVVAAKELIARTYDYDTIATFDSLPVEPPNEAGKDDQLVQMHLVVAQLTAQLGLIHASGRHLWDSALSYVASPDEIGWNPEQCHYWWVRRYGDRPWPLASRYPDVGKDEATGPSLADAAAIAAGLDAQAPDNAG